MLLAASPASSIFQRYIYAESIFPTLFLFFVLQFHPLCLTTTSGSSSSSRCFAAAALPPKPARPDLEATPSITYPASSSSNTALLPTFGGSPVNVTYVEQAVPKLDKQTIQRVKAAAIAALPADLQASIKSIKTVGPSGFQHPSCMVSPAELAVMKDRLNNGQQPQTMAKDALLTGKYYAFDAKIAAPKSFKGWVLPYDTPATGRACMNKHLAAAEDVGPML